MDMNINEFITRALEAAAARAGGTPYRIVFEKAAAQLRDDDPLQELIKENNL